MKCENSYCIYNDNSFCLLDEICVNSLGMCESCIIVSFPEELIAKEKKIQREKLEY